MKVFINYMVVLLTLYPLIKSIFRVIRAKFSILHLTIIVFWSMQIAPMLLENFFGLGKEVKYYPNMYAAMQDDRVTYIYGLFCFSIIWVLFAFANRSVKCHKYVSCLVNQKHINKCLRIMIFAGMFVLPFLGVIFSPSPQIYLTFSYFYKYKVEKMSFVYLYHKTIISKLSYLAFVCAMLLYLLRDQKRCKSNIDIYISIAMFTWIDGKRALLIFSLVGIVIIDIIKHNFDIKKTIVLGMIAIVYFGVYVKITGKGSNTDFISNYYFYYSRMNSIKTSIYAFLNKDRIVEYTGQTILFDLLFFIPRIFWMNKPKLFCKYFTAYSLGRKNTEFATWNLHVNIWTEFISNFGLIGGSVLVIIILLLLVKVVEQSNDMRIYLSGTAFIVFYSMFGFETVVMFIYIALIAFLVREKILRKFLINGRKI